MYDCHSNETNWKWYSYIAPASWLVAHHVKKGREHINFSNWGNIPIDKKEKIVEEVWEEIEEDKMPLKIYTLMHKNAVLHEEQKEIIREWSLLSE